MTTGRPRLAAASLLLLCAGGVAVPMACSTAPANTSDASGDPDALDADVAEVGTGFELGRWTQDTTFEPIEDGVVLEIVQGEQGGVHVEVAVRVWEPQAGDPAYLHIEGRVIEAGGLIAYTDVLNFPFRPAGQGAWVSDTVFIFLAQNVADPYIGANVLVRVTVTPKGGEPTVLEVEASLVDDD